MFERSIHIGLSPNTSTEDFIAALKLIFRPWIWVEGDASGKVEAWFKDYFRVDTAVSFNGGRSALLAILHSLELPPGSEILVQAFTCVAVPNSVMWANLKPVFVDVDRSLNIDVADAVKKISAKTKALIVQHTFGLPADMEKILVFCKKHNLILVEDCAHSLGATYQGKQIGTFGMAAFFSFGRDKIISSVFGGMAITDNNSLGKKITQYQQKLSYPRYFWIYQQLLHPILCSVILPIYNVLSLGKLFLFILQKIGLLAFPVYDQEKKGLKPVVFPARYPNALAGLLLVQLERLAGFNHKRRVLAKHYAENLAKSGFTLPQKLSGAVYLRYNIITYKADELRFKLKKNGVISGNWYKNVIDPQGVNMDKIGYLKGSCPNAESIAARSLNLPTYPALKKYQVERILKPLVL